MFPSDLSQTSGARRVFKTALPVPVRFATEDGVAATLEGPVAYSAGDALLTGVNQETWPVQRPRFELSYGPAPGTEAGRDGLYLRNFEPVWALQLAAPLEVSVGWQHDTLQGKPGDWLLQYGPADFGIVAAAIFAQTYQFIDAAPAA